MPTLRHATTIDAWVSKDAAVREAVERLVDDRVPTLAVVDADRRVVGLFTERDAIAALVPPYLRELRHTAFADDDPEALARRGREVTGEPVTAHMSSAVVLELDTSITHAAERFLHAPGAALAVVERGRFVGILTRSEIARLLLQQTRLG